MTRRPLRGGLLATVSAMLIAGGTGAANAAPDREMGQERSLSSVSFKETKPPKPKVKGKGTAWGSTITGTQNRRTTKRSAPPVRHAAGKPPKPSRKQIPKAPRDTDGARPSFRLNVGICGRLGPDGTVPGPTRCQPTGPVQPRRPGRPVTPPRVVQPRPEDVAWEQVLAESRDVVFPKLTVHVQPKDRTLVNLETIVYTDDRGVTTVPVTVAGFRVIVRAVPTSYTWHFGDGSSKTTESPGKPYPSKEIIHRYMKRGDVRLSVTVNYDASFEVQGLAPQFIGAVPITGPATPLLVREAVPVLVAPPR